MVAASPLLPPPSAEVDELDESSLVTEDDRPVDGILTEKQERLLTEPLYTSWAGPPPEDGDAARPFAALANVGLFSSLTEQPVVPDVMLSLDVTIPSDMSDPKNRSYFVWRYGKPPELVVEIVSNRKGDEVDRKLRRYRRVGVDYYVVFDPLKKLAAETVRAFERQGGRYVRMDRLWFGSVGLGLVEWEGSFEGTPGRWLRWCTHDGELLLTGAELAAQQKARAETEKARADRLAARLREMGIDPDGDG